MPNSNENQVDKSAHRAGVTTDDEDLSINKTSVLEFLDGINFEELPGIRQKYRREHRAFEARTWDLTQRYMKEAKELGLNEQEAKDAFVQHMFEQEIYKNGKFNSYLHERNHTAIIKQALAPYTCRASISFCTG